MARNKGDAGNKKGRQEDVPRNRAPQSGMSEQSDFGREQDLSRQPEQLNRGGRQSDMSDIGSGGDDVQQHRSGRDDVGQHRPRGSSSGERRKGLGGSELDQSE